MLRECPEPDRRLGDPCDAPRRRVVAVVAIAVGNADRRCSSSRSPRSPTRRRSISSPSSSSASVGGTVPAVVTALAAFLVYDLLFTEPRFSLAVADPSELLNLVLVLIVALAVGRLAALGRERAAEADRRATEATGLFAVSRLLATADSDRGGRRRRSSNGSPAMPPSSGSGSASTAARASGSWPTRATDRRRAAAIVTTLVRMPGDEPARWVRAHEPAPRQATGRAADDRRRRRPGQDRDRRDRLRVALGRQAGWFRAARSARRPASCRSPPTRSRSGSGAIGSAGRPPAPRSLAGATPSRARCSTRSRTTCARHSPASGPRPATWPIPTWRGRRDEVRRAAETIDAEAQRLDRFVRSVLDLSRIESGALRPDLEVFDLPELRRAGRGPPPAGARRPSDHDRPRARPPARPGRRRPLRCDRRERPRQRRRPHAARHAPARSAPVRGEPGRVRLTIEDGGPGVADVGPRSRLRQVPARTSRPGEGARRGMGVGLSIVRGMAEALGGTATARRSDLGGLAIELDLPAAPEPPAERGDSRDDPHGAHILLVEDDDATRSSVAANLSAHGYRVAEASDVRTRAGELGDGPAGRDPARPRPARRRRPRAHPARPPRRDHADPGPLRARRRARQGRGPREPAPTTTSPSRSACRSSERAIGALLRRSGGPGADPEGRLTLGPVVIDVARRVGHGRRDPRRPDAARVRAAQDDDRPARPAPHPRPPAARRLGRGLRRRGALPARLRQPAAPQARRRRPDRPGERPDRRRARRRLPDRRGADPPT